MRHNEIETYRWDKRERVRERERTQGGIKEIIPLNIS